MSTDAPRSSAATLSDVAKVAGVSPGTVSRVLSQRGDFRPDTRARVLAAAEALGYDRSWTRRGRRAPEATTVDLIVGQVSHAWSDRAVRGAWHGAVSMGLDLTLTTERLEDDNDDWPSRVVRRGTAGIIIGLAHPSPSQLATLRAAHVPVVLLEPITGSWADVCSVGTTNFEGGYAAGAHLAETGIVDFVSVQARPAYKFVRGRESGFQAAVEASGPDSRLRTVRTGWDGAGPVPELAKVMADRRGRLGVFASNDAIALRCYESAFHAGLRVGVDVLVVGFDDEVRAARATPPLTTLHQPIEQMTAKAVEIICGGAAEELWLNPERHELPANLVIRESTAGPGSG
ncbi:LacI family DNA-binding transcriptional regulator [Tessaracoccus defluvii]|uniref:LacI family DNA-binding transcriptional regulator n=1 Tax=Tessaracoccus defluvii TaxID=1285901 RepID=A0A7H0H4I2_9ACTN|nr:LacI family DNA-binding transcriptional regulator [Tessaracoccus defluvii]QNP55448.1 LacI family DNA-binding transcriptional regulator [Tessaracoccus defluvii]